jgi:glycosyltransferase involved in cell wall biosynthesis
MLKGNIDIASTREISGWAQDEAQPKTPVSLVITENGEFVGRVLANGYRPDLEEAGIGNGRYAFEFEFPSVLAPYISHVIRVRRETDGAELPGSPATLKAAQSFDSVVEEALTRTLGLGGEEDLPRKIDFLVDQIDKLLQQHADAESTRADRSRYRRLLQRWGRQLPQAGGAIAARALPPPSLRALVIDDRLPKGDRDAGSNAMLSHIRSLQRLGYHVTIAPAIDFSPAAADRAALEATGVACCCSPYYGSVEEVLRRQAGEFDLVYLHRVSNASKYGELAHTHFPKARRIYSVADLHHIRLLRQAKVEDRPELVALSQRVRLAELAATAFSNAVITHSNSESDLLKSQVLGASVFTMRWSVKPQPTKVPFSKRRGFAFIGGYGHAPNLDAVRWLIKDIMPLVRARDPTIQCFLVGSDMPDQFRKITDDGIVPLGHVADLADIFDRVRLTVAPLAYGAGIKGKVIESLSAGVPCICTPIAAEGLDLPAALRACVAENPDAIAASIVRLHSEKTENDRCRRAGLEFIKSEFSEQQLDVLMRQAAGLTGEMIDRPPSKERLVQPGPSNPT